MGIIQIILLITFVLLFVGLYGVFQKAGEKGWKALIPIYNIVIWLKIIHRPWWWATTFWCLNASTLPIPIPSAVSSPPEKAGST